jgi:AraC-like DNA-binding protein
MINYYQRALTNPKIFKQLFCKDLLFVYYDCPLGSNRQDSWSQYNYILYVVTGRKVFSSNTRSWLLTEGTAVFVKKGACIIEKVNGEVLCLMAFFIPDNYLRSFLSENRALMTKEKNNTHDSELVISLEVNEMMLAYYESVIPYFHLPIKPSEDLLELKFRELLFNIIGNPANIELNSFLHTLVSPQANNIQPIIEANYCYNLALDEYAKLCNRSLSSFKRDFYNLYGESPARWILNKRLSLALKLLCNSNNSIVDISFESGFENSTHFSHVFKKNFGISPLKYRQQKSILQHSE